MTSAVKPVRFLCAGLGGYAWSIAQQFLTVGECANAEAKLAAVCDPALDQFADRVATLQARGVRAYRNMDEMIQNEDADAVWLPLPIHLHRPFTEQALAAGKHVVTEKPASGCLQDVDAMIAARDRAGREVLVGFQDIYALTTVPFKRAVLEGAIGKITHATVHAAWPRDKTYFSRNRWAGAIAVNGTWVLDSPLQNAISHHVNLALFMLGKDVYDSERPVAVEAELYRANQIENYDTCALRLTLPGDVTLSVFLTHAAPATREATVRLVGTEGSLTSNDHGCTIAGKHSQNWPADQHKHISMIRAISRRIRGQATDSAFATLEMARIHTGLVNAVSEAASVATVDKSHIYDSTHNGNPLVCVNDILSVMQRCIENRQLPSELGNVPWAAPGGQKDLRQYHAFAGPKVG